MASKLLLASTALLAAQATAWAQELEPRAYPPSPIGTTFVLGGFARSQGPILLDPSLDVDNAEGDLWIASVGVGHIFGLAGRQTRVLAIVPIAWGNVEGDVGGRAERQDLRGLADPRVKFTVGLRGAPALTAAEFARAPRRLVFGASVTIAPPWGQYESTRLINLGYNRWALKPELGLTPDRPLDVRRVRRRLAVQRQRRLLSRIGDAAAGSRVDAADARELRTAAAHVAGVQRHVVRRRPDLR
jgi:hypothetical protein